MTSDPILERAARARSRLDLEIPDSKPSLLVYSIMMAQQPDGSWRPETTAWGDIATAMAVEVLHRSEISMVSAWDLPGTAAGTQAQGGIGHALDYLAKNQQNSRWGSDWFDHGRVVRILASLRGYLSADLCNRLDAGVEELRVALAHGFDQDPTWSQESEWAGSATFAAACLAFAEIDDKKAADDSMRSLLELQDPDGSFRGTTERDDLRVWHTANAVLALRGMSIPPTSAKVRAATSWLKDQRDDHDKTWGDGPWSRRCDFTAYVAQAILECEGAEVPEVSDAVTWLLSVQDTRGAIGTLEGTLHSGLLLARMARSSAVVPISFPTVIEASSLLGEMTDLIKAYQVEARELKEANEAAEKRTSDYVVTLTSRQVAFWSFVVGIISLAAALAALA